MHYKDCCGEAAGEGGLRRERFLLATQISHIKLEVCPCLRFWNPKRDQGRLGGRVGGECADF